MAPMTGRADGLQVPARLSVRDVSVVYDAGRGRSITALIHAQVDIAPGEFFTCVGPSGCGKTTLLRTIAGLRRPTSGVVVVDGAEVVGPGEDRAVVFQEYALLPWRNVLGNVRFGLELRKRDPIPRGEWHLRIAEAIALVGLRGFERHYPHQLSGGMKQRVGLARALVLRPRVLLMDEPFAALDAMTREIMQVELLRILTDTNATAFFITHSIDEAIVLGDRIGLMSARPGRFLEIIENHLPTPRWRDDFHSLKEYGDLRDNLWHRLRNATLEQSG